MYIVKEHTELRDGVESRHDGARRAGHEIFRVRWFPLALQLTTETRKKGSSLRPLSIHLDNLKGKITCLLSSYCTTPRSATNGVPSFVEAIAITAEKIAVWARIRKFAPAGSAKRVIDGGRRTIIPGSQRFTHDPIVARLQLTKLGLAWDGVPRCRRIAQAERTAGETPAPRVRG